MSIYKAGVQFFIGVLWKGGYLHCGEKVVISSSSDIHKISSNCSIVHFRKFISKNAVFQVISKCDKLEKVIISKSAYRGCDVERLRVLEGNPAEVVVSENRGRPSPIQGLIYIRNEEKDSV